MMKMNVYRMFLSGCRRCIHFFIITNHHSWAVFSNMQLFCIESTLFLWACDINVSFKPQYHLIIGIVNALRRSLTIPSTVTSLDTSSKSVHHPINNQCVVASMLQRRRDDGTSVVPSNTILSFQREREETGERRGSILGLVTIFLYCIIFRQYISIFLSLFPPYNTYNLPRPILIVSSSGSPKVLGLSPAFHYYFAVFYW